MDSTLRPFNPQLHPLVSLKTGFPEWKVDTIFSIVKRNISFALVINCVIWVDRLCHWRRHNEVCWWLFICFVWNGCELWVKPKNQTVHLGCWPFQWTLSSWVLGALAYSLAALHNCHSFWAHKVWRKIVSLKNSCAVTWPSDTEGLTLFLRGAQVIMGFPKGMIFSLQS